MRFLLTAIRVAALLATLTAGCRVLWWAAAGPAYQAWRGLHGWVPAQGWSLELLVADALACVALVSAAILVTITVMTVLRGILATVRPTLGAAVPALGPRGWRRLVLALCGLGVVTPALSAPVFAADHPTGAPCDVHCSAPLVGLELPDLPLSAPATDSVRVRTGDSLWTIVESAAEPGAADVAVAADVAAIYLRNRAVIGPDPDLIHPGTTLILPGASHDPEP